MWWKLITGVGLNSFGFLDDDEGGGSGGQSDDTPEPGDDDFLNIDESEKDESEGEGLLNSRRDKKQKKDADKKSDESPPVVGERPEFLEEKYWDAEKGEPRIEALAKSNTDLFSQLQRLRGQKSVPESKETYLEGMFDKDGNLRLPEDVKNLTPISKDDPLFSEFTEVAHRHGFTDDQFKGVVRDFFQLASKSVPEPFDNDAFVAEQKKLLGPNADEMIDHSISWIESLAVQGHLSADQAKALYDGVGASGHGVLAIQKLYKMVTGEAGIPTDVPTPDRGIPTQDEWYQMKLSKRYREDEEFKKEVDGLAPQVFPGTGQANFGRLGMSQVAQRDAQERQDRALQRSSKKR